MLTDAPRDPEAELARERHRAERLALLTRVSRLVTADLQLDDLLQCAADAIHELLGYDAVAIALRTPDAPDVLDLRHFGGRYKAEIGGAHRIPVTHGLIGTAARTREVVFVNDAPADPRYLPTPGIAAPHAELAIPLLLGDDVLGVLNVERGPPFGAEDVEHLRVAADQLAVAIENARLHEAARRAAVLEERGRLARELHDSVSQQLFTAAMVAQGLDAAYARDAAEGARRAAMLVGLTRGALAEMRSLLAELRPAVTAASASPPPPDAGLARLRGDGGGLVAALRAHIATHLAPELVGALEVTLDVAGYAPQPGAREEALYRVAREALHNVVRHARARHADVRLSCTRSAVRLTVRDDGVGFTPADMERRRRHTGGLGLFSMRARVEQLGGTLQVTSAPTAGTRLAVWFPLGASTETPTETPA